MALFWWWWWLHVRIYIDKDAYYNIALVFSGRVCIIRNNVWQAIYVPQSSHPLRVCVCVRLPIAVSANVCRCDGGCVIEINILYM